MPEDTARRSSLSDELVPRRRWTPTRPLAQLTAVVSGDLLVAVGVAILGLAILIALTAPWIAPYPAQGRGTADVANRDLAPSAAHLFGTDHLGRDIVSRVMFGTRPALAVSFVVVFAAILIGVAIGSVAGYLGGWVDEILMRITDVFLSFPPLLLTMIIASLLGPSLVHAAIALVVSWWPWYARLVRTVAQSIRQRPYIEAARISGAPVYRILRRHVLRNSWSPVFVQAAIDFGTVILAAGSLAFLGLGAQPPTADWGLMVADGRTTVTSEWWIPTFPGLAIFVVVLGTNLLGDGMQNLLKPGSGRR